MAIGLPRMDSRTSVCFNLEIVSVSVAGVSVVVELLLVIISSF